MKIVIDIDNETYGRIQALVNADYFEHDICGYSMQRIANGTPYEERPKGEWIPVSERLPEGKIDPMTNDFELVLCSTVWEVVRPYKFGKPIGHSKAHFWSGGGIMDDYVIAWKPMPEPYKEEAKNEDSH